MPLKLFTFATFAISKSYCIDWYVPLHFPPCQWDRLGYTRGDMSQVKFFPLNSYYCVNSVLYQVCCSVCAALLLPPDAAWSTGAADWPPCWSCDCPSHFQAGVLCKLAPVFSQGSPSVRNTPQVKKDHFLKIENITVNLLQFSVWYRYRSTQRHL